jgi:conjugative transfer region lipoprotein (TIGR03751 family)
MKIHYKKLIVSLISVLGVVSLSGCSNLLSSKMPTGSVSMHQAYDDAINGTNSSIGGGSLNQVRAKLNTLRQQHVNYSHFTRTQENEINSQFLRLPNPSIVMYVYPHEAGSGYNITPVPGYSTVFPLYRHVYYTMLGERTIF